MAAIRRGGHRDMAAVTIGRPVMAAVIRAARLRVRVAPAAGRRDHRQAMVAKLRAHPDRRQARAVRAVVRRDRHRAMRVVAVARLGRSKGTAAAAVLPGRLRAMRVVEAIRPDSSKAMVVGVAAVAAVAAVAVIARPDNDSRCQRASRRTTISQGAAIRSDVTARCSPSLNEYGPDDGPVFV